MARLYLKEEGSFTARVLEYGTDVTPSGKERFVIGFEIIDGEHSGRYVSFSAQVSTARSQEWIADTLAKCGWDKVGDIDMIIGNHVRVKTQIREWKGKQYCGVKYVNKAFDSKPLDKLDKYAKSRFINMFKDAAVRSAEKLGGENLGEETPFD